MTGEHELSVLLPAVHTPGVTVSVLPRDTLSWQVRSNFVYLEHDTVSGIRDTHPEDMKVAAEGARISIVCSGCIWDSQLRGRKF